MSTHQSPLETEAEARSEFSSSPSLHPAPRGRRASYYLSINITLLLLMLGALSVLSLLFFLLSWSVVPSISMLALFFAAWQCISAVFFVQLALFLRSLVEEGESGTVTSRREGSKFVIEGGEEEGE